MVKTIQKSVVIEDLVREYPKTVGFMIREGLPCFVCGEPTWGTFEDMARRSGKAEPEIDRLIEEMNSYVRGGSD